MASSNHIAPAFTKLYLTLLPLSVSTAKPEEAKTASEAFWSVSCLQRRCFEVRLKPSMFVWWVPIAISAVAVAAVYNIGHIYAVFWRYMFS
jgi:hypothetical protein